MKYVVFWIFIVSVVLFLVSLMTGNFSFLAESFFVHSRDYLARELPHSQKWTTYSHVDLTFSQKHYVK